MAIFSGLAAAIGGLLGGTFLSGAVGSFLIKAAVGIGLNLLASSLAGQPEKPTFSVQGQLQIGGDVSRAFILGTTATAGSLVYANTWGQAGKTPNAYFTQVIALSDIPTKGLAAVWVNGERCTVLTDSPHADYGWPIEQYRYKGKDYLWVKFYDGTQATADSFLVDHVGTEARPYESTRVGRGVSYAICTARINDKLFTGFPAYKFEVLGARLYDVSKDSTAGGSGSHRVDNPATWGGDGDDLPAVQVHALLRGLYYGADWFYGLQGVSPVRLPAANWRVQIGKCRLGVDKPGGGTEAQYLAGLEIQVNAPIADAVSAFLTSCQGRLIDSGGVYTLRVGAPDAAVFAFSDGDILSTEQQTFTPFFGLADTINGISATYPEPAEGWNAKAAPSLYRPDLEAKDGNRRLLANVDLGAVSHSSQVQRLMKSALEEARRARRNTIVLGPSAWVLEPGDTVLWTSERNGYNAKLMRVDGVVDKANLDVILDLTEVDPSDYNWNPATDYEAPTFGWLGPVRPTPQEIVDWSVSPATIDNAAGDGRRPAIRLEWNGEVDDVQAVAYEVRLTATSQIVYRGRTDEVEAGSILLSQNLLPATAYQVHGRYVPRNDRDVEWSSWRPVTTPNILFDGDDILNGAIDDLKLADRAVKTLKIELEAIKAELIANNAIIASKIANGAVTIAKFAAGIEPVGLVPGTTIPTTKTTEVIFVDGKLYRWNGTQYVAEIDAADIAGVLTDAQIASLAASKITGQMTNAQIADLNAAKIVGQLVASQIANAAITVAKFASGIQPVTIVAGTTIPTTKTTDVILVDGVLYRWNGTAYKADVDAAHIQGELTNAQIASLAASKITGQMTNSQIADLAAAKIVGQVVASQIADAAITTAKFAAGIRPVELVSALPGAPHIKGRQVQLSSDDKVYRNTGTGWVSSVAADDISGQVQAAQIAALEAVKITGLIAGTQISDNAISSPKIAAGAIIAGKLAVGAVLAASIAAGAITTDKLDALAVTADKLAVNSVTAGKVAAGAISATEIAAGAVTASKLFVGDTTNLIPDAQLLDIASWSVGATWSVTANPVKGARPNLDPAARALFSTDNVTGVGNDAYRGEISPSTGGSVDRMLAVKAGDDINISYAWRTLSTAQGNIRCYIRWRDSDGNVILQEGGPRNDAPQVSFDDVSANFTAPAGAAAMDIRWRRGSSVTTGNSVSWFTVINPAIRWRSKGELIVDGAIYAEKLAAGAVVASKIATGAVTANAIAANAITAVKIQAGSIDTAHIAVGAIEADKIASGAVTTGKLSANAVTADKLSANSVVAGKIAAGAVSATEIAANAITASKMFVGDATNLVPDPQMIEFAGSWFNGTRIAGNAAWGAPWLFLTPTAVGTAWPVCYGSVFAVEPGLEYHVSAVARTTLAGTGTARLQIDTAPSADMSGIVRTDLDNTTSTSVTQLSASHTVAAGHFFARIGFRVSGDGNSAIFGQPKIRRKNGGELIVDGAITAVKIQAGSIDTAHIAVGAIEADKIASGAVTTGKLSAFAVTADKLSANSVTAGKVAAGAISAAEIAAGAIVASKLFIGDWTNLVPDPQFMEGTGSWIGGTRIAGNSGWQSPYIWVVTGSASAWGSTFSSVMAVEPGSEYYLSCLTRVVSGPGSARIRIQVAATQDMAGATAYDLTNTTSGSVTTLGAAFTIPAGMYFARFLFSSTIDTQSYFSCPRMRRKSAGELIVDGAIYAPLIATNAITADKIVAGAITALHLGAGSVTAVKIAAGAVTTDKMTVSSLAAISANFGNATFTGVATSSNGKMTLDFTNGRILIKS